MRTKLSINIDQSRIKETQISIDFDRSEKRVSLRGGLEVPLYLNPS